MTPITIAFAVSTLLWILFIVLVLVRSGAPRTRFAGVKSVGFWIACFGLLTTIVLWPKSSALPVDAREDRGLKVSDRVSQLAANIEQLQKSAEPGGALFKKLAAMEHEPDRTAIDNLKQELAKMETQNLDLKRELQAAERERLASESAERAATKKGRESNVTPVFVELEDVKLSGLVFVNYAPAKKLNPSAAHSFGMFSDLSGFTKGGSEPQSIYKASLFPGNWRAFIMGPDSTEWKSIGLVDIPADKKFVLTKLKSDGIESGIGEFGIDVDAKVEAGADKPK